MATSATTAVFQCPVRGGDAGEADVVVSWSLTSPVEILFSQVLTQGAHTTINIPASPNPDFTLLVIIPPVTNTQSVTIKGNITDTGLLISADKPTILSGIQGNALSILLGSGTNQTFKFRCI